MYICPMDRDFQWIRKVIGSITHFGQIQSAENLIDLYVKKYQDSEELRRKFFPDNEADITLNDEELKQSIEEEFKESTKATLIIQRRTRSLKEVKFSS